MSEFRKLVENVLKENDVDWVASDSDATEQSDYESRMKKYLEELRRYDNVTIDDRNEMNEFLDYVYSMDYDNLGFDTDDLRREGNYIYLA